MAIQVSTYACTLHPLPASLPSTTTSKRTKTRPCAPPPPLLRCRTGVPGNATAAHASGAGRGGLQGYRTAAGSESPSDRRTAAAPANSQPRGHISKAPACPPTAANGRPPLFTWAAAVICRARLVIRAHLQRPLEEGRRREPRCSPWIECASDGSVPDGKLLPPPVTVCSRLTRRRRRRPGA